MAGSKFHAPPGWPVPAGWSPPPDWEPPREWPPAPPGWRFWADDEGGNGLRRHPGVLIGALGAVAVLVVVAVIGFVRMNHRDGAQARPERMLPSTYPTEPQVAWSRQTTELSAGSRPTIANFGPQFAGVTAAVAGNHLILRVSPNGGNYGSAELVSLSLSDGHTEWSVASDLSIGCAGGVVDNALPCIRSDAQRNYLDFIDTGSGRVVSSYQPPFRVAMVATDGQSIYLMGGDQTGLKVSKGSRDNPVAAWTTTVPEGACAGASRGDSVRLRVEHGLVIGDISGGVGALLRTSDGTTVADHDVDAVEVTNNGDTITAQRCEQGGDFAHWSSELLDNHGRVLASTGDNFIRRAMDVHAGGNAPLLTSTGDALDAGSGEKRWHITQSTDPTTAPYQSWAIGSVLITGGSSAGLTGYDVQSGRQLWHTSGGSTYPDALTDGSRFIVPNGHGITAYSTADGTEAWSSALTSANTLVATDAGLVVIGADQVALLRATGPPAAVPNINGSSGISGGTRLVTKCGRTPQFVPEAIRSESGGLVIKMKIVAFCPGGDVLASPQTQISVTSGGQNVASGTFDLSSAPIVIPPADTAGGSGSQPAVEHEFHFPLGTFWRLPVSTQSQPAAGQTQQGPVDLDPSTMIVACQESGSSSGSAQFDPSSAGTNSSSAATGPAPPATGDPESASFDALRAIANSDHPFVTSQLADRWVAQLSSKKPGIVDDGITWDNAATLREHLRLRLQYPEVRLLWSGDWSTFSEPDFWVTIAGVTFADAGDALAWCTSHNLDRDHCYAKLVSTTHPVDDSTAYNP